MMWRSDSSDVSSSTGLPRTTDRPEVVDAVRTALDACPKPGEAPDENPWHELVYDRLRDRALPALISEGTITPAASLWTGSRLWTEAFRATDLQPGDRIVLAVPPSACFAQVLIAALWEGYTIALLRPESDVDAALDAVDARAAVTPTSGTHAWRAEGVAGPLSTPDALRNASEVRTPDVRFLLRTSGTTGTAQWVALSDRNVLSVLASHLPKYRLGDARVLSVLPWSHAFGLVLDFFPALLSGAEIIRDPDGGRDPESLIRLSRAWGATHLSAVPLTVQRLFETGRGDALLHQLQGGTVGGAPVSGALAERLADTRMRVGYGQTEAAPGIALGDRGVWSANYLGKPLGCTVTVADDGELLFEGSNACVGFWVDGALQRKDPNRRVATGDLVRKDGDHLFFQGRKDDGFKLSNGRLVHAGYWEARLKTAFPVLDDALVFTYDGTNVAVALHLASDTDEEAAPSADDVRDALDRLGDRCTWMTVVDDANWHATPKGSVDRRAMTEWLVESYDADQLNRTRV